MTTQAPLHLFNFSKYIIYWLQNYEEYSTEKTKANMLISKWSTVL